MLLIKSFFSANLTEKKRAPHPPGYYGIFRQQFFITMHVFFIEPIDKKKAQSMH